MAGFDFIFSVESMIRGYHEYQLIWNDPIIGEELGCEREPGNSHDPYAVAVKKAIGGSDRIVGHVPRRISTICSLFIRRGRLLVCIINGVRRYSSDLPQGGLEIPCKLIFKSVNADECQKAKKLIQSTLSVEVFEVCAPTRPTNQQALPAAANQGQELVVSSEQPCELPVVIVPEQHNEGPEEAPPLRKRVKCIDTERIIMGEELCDIEINFAQQLLKEQFSELNGLVSTLYQDRRLQMTESLVRNKVQIIHCKGRRHWIVATTLNCQLGEVRVYDSLFQYCGKETEHVIANLFQVGSVKLKITVSQSQKQKGGTDCGIFAIAFATALAFGINLSKLQLKQESMRAHLINCFNKHRISPFPRT